MRHLNPQLERLEERVAPCLGVSLPALGITIGCQSSGDSCDGSSASGTKSSKSKSAESCSS